MEDIAALCALRQRPRRAVEEEGIGPIPTIAGAIILAIIIIYVGLWLFGAPVHL